MRTIARSVSVLAIFALSACGGSTMAAPGGAADVPAPPRGDIPMAAAAPSPTPAAQALVPTDDAPSFSAEQADRGRGVFRSSCTECHYSNEFSDRSFKFKWRRRTAGDLFGHISTSMPEDAPGSLELQQYADVVAYILRMNGFETGVGELPADKAALAAISLAPFGN